ncbi:hypothetical protein CPter291_4326 [Collimonas pratensis]|uniref:Uncharacterized protein n=1 Tax=Collimonas pratensis TaxID=279113 RepID=A0ABN4MH50_9BURK|nr:hypothetical protein CPter291_4326 [Collimonas pratensis]
MPIDRSSPAISPAVRKLPERTKYGFASCENGISGNKEALATFGQALFYLDLCGSLYRIDYMSQNCDVNM